jgi:DNA-binding GntR family transcriptional regulator
MRKPDLLNVQSKKDALALKIRQSIFNGNYPVGTYIRQNSVAETYGVSPTPVREALLVLEAEGLLIHEPNQGFRVTDWGGSFEQFCLLREAVETLAVEMALKSITPEIIKQMELALQGIQRGTDLRDQDLINKSHNEFHQILISSCGFPALQEILRTIWAKLPWDMLLSISETQQVSVKEHEAILDLIRNKKHDEVTKLYRAHVCSIRKYLSREQLNNRSK